MRTRQLYSSVTATQSGAIYFDMPDKSVIRGVAFGWNPATATMADGDYVEAEVSISSSNQTAVSDAQSIIAIFTAGTKTSGSPATVMQVGANTYSPASFPVEKGQRVFLNVTENGSGTHRIRALIWYD